MTKHELLERAMPRVLKVLEVGNTTGRCGHPALPPPPPGFTGFALPSNIVLPKEVENS